MMELEGMLLQVQWCHGSPFYFWFKPKDKQVIDGFELKTDKDFLAMFEDMRRKRYRKVDVYADLFGTFRGNSVELAVVYGQVPKTTVDNTPPGTKLRICIIEELPDDANVTVDARVSARPKDCYDQSSNEGDVDGGSADDSDSSVKIIETLDEIGEMYGGEAEMKAQQMRPILIQVRPIYTPTCPYSPCQYQSTIPKHMPKTTFKHHPNQRKPKVAKHQHKPDPIHKAKLAN
uniref:Uncharacterized protein n=1 Tax=Cannabis sativa TaxID=3483 RepID=A0A803NJX2_CANSA